MSLVRWKPKQYDPVKEFFDMDQPFFGLSFPALLRNGEQGRDSWYPAMDISEDKDSLIVKADLPGLNKEDVSISVDGTVLTVRGERKSEVEKKEKDYHRVERSYGVFQRSIDLGSSIDESKIKAKYKNGVLEVVLPKTAKQQSKQISIETE